jgi:DNA-binding NtrC family response regulator
MPRGMDPVLVASPNTALRRRIIDSIPKTRRVEQANGGAEALVRLESGNWKLLLLDRRLPDLDAEELSQTVRSRYPAVEVVLLDEADALATQPGAEAADALQGISPFLGHGISEQPDVGRSNHAADVIQRRWDDASLSARGHILPAPILPGMVGQSAAMQAVYRLVKLVAPRDTTVLITGPTGCGKELVARAVHQFSPRAARAFSVVNCAAIPETLLEAELFGYSRGAFTGAFQSYAGRIQTAHRGTLFLDEIGDMPLNLQPKLLRFLEQKELQRLGSTQIVQVDTRVVAATNADLLTLVKEGRFREDLYYRLSSFPVIIPPLSERPEDIVSLAIHFLERFSAGQSIPTLSDEAAARLRSQKWPGNVRELENVIERALIVTEGAPVIRAAHLMFNETSPPMSQRDLGTARSIDAIRAF